MLSLMLTREAAGVARPIWNKVTPAWRLMKKATGILTPNAPMIPYSMTKSVRLFPLKNPTKQNRNEVRMQSMAYAFK